MVEFFCLCASVFLFTHGAEPIEIMKQWLGFSSDSEVITELQFWMIKLVNCSMCTGFWVGLVYYQSFLMGCALSICSEALTRIMNRI